MAISIVIYNTSACINAVEWCAKNILVENWKIDSLWPLDGIKFGFKQTEDAVLFSLMCLSS